MRALFLPQGPDKYFADITEVEVDGWREMAKAIGDGCTYIERVKCVLTQVYSVVLVVDEEFLYSSDVQPNQVATALYPFQQIYGNALLVAEGMTAEGMDFISITDEKLMHLRAALGISTDEGVRS